MSGGSPRQPGSSLTMKRRSTSGCGARSASMPVSMKCSSGSCCCSNRSRIGGEVVFAVEIDRQRRPRQRAQAQVAQDGADVAAPAAERGAERILLDEGRTEQAMRPLQIIVRHAPAPRSRRERGRAAPPSRRRRRRPAPRPARAPRPRPPACNGRRAEPRLPARDRLGHVLIGGAVTLRIEVRRRAEPALEIAGIDEVAVQVGDLPGGGGGGDVGVGPAVEFLRERQLLDRALDDPAQQRRVDRDLAASVQPIPVDAQGLEQQVHMREILRRRHIALHDPAADVLVTRIRRRNRRHAMHDDAACRGCASDHRRCRIAPLRAMAGRTCRRRAPDRSACRSASRLSAPG